eukprot:gene1914-biopygen10355
MKNCDPFVPFPQFAIDSTPFPSCSRGTPHTCLIHEACFVAQAVRRDLVREALPPRRLPPSPLPGGVPPLDHEVAHDAVEEGPVVVPLCAQPDEVVARHRRHRAVQAEVEVPHARLEACVADPLLRADDRVDARVDLLTRQRDLPVLAQRGGGG